MTFFLPSTGSALDLPGTPALMQAEPSFGETVAAGVEAERIEIDSWNRAQRTSRAVLADQRQQVQAAGLYEDGPDFGRADRNSQRRFFTDLDFVLARNADLVAQNPELRQMNAAPPTTRDEFADRVTARLKAEHADAMDVLNVGGSGAEFLGRMWAGVTDQSTVLTAPFGAPAGGRILAFAATEAALGVASELLVIEQQRETAERLDLPPPSVAAQLGMAALTGGVIGGGLGGAIRYAEYRATRRAAQAKQTPEGAPSFTFGDHLAAATRDMQGAPPPPGGQPAPQQPTPTVPDGAPPDWPEIRNGIFAGESGGDYGAVFGYQNRPGGRFDGVRLTDLTLDEWLEFARPSGPYGQWVKSQIGRVATPMGAYQIVGTTLRHAKKAMGLRGDEVMDGPMQDRIGLWIYQTQGTGAWEGYRGPRAEVPTPPASGAPATGGAPASETFGGFTSRGYTDTGQVTAGDGLTIDVQYQVVDLSTLSRATGDLQPRDRTRASSDEQVAEIAARLDPARLMPSPEADRGAPIVGPDNTIESGNGRVMALERAYQQHPDRIDAYRRQITAAGYEVPDGIAQPVLIARRTSDLDDAGRQAFVRAANTSQVARMSATERAGSEARALNVATMALWRGGKLDAPENAPFVRAFLDSLPQAERAGLVDARKILNAEGQRRIRDALFARAWPAPDIVARWAETDAGDLKTLLDALSDAAPDWAALRAAVADGRVRPEMDITDYVLEAMRLIATARDIAASEGGSVAARLRDLLAQDDLLSGAVAPLTRALIEKFAPGGRVARANTVTDFLNSYAREAQNIGGTDAALFAAPGPLDALRAIDRDSFGDLTEIGRPTVLASLGRDDALLDDLPTDRTPAQEQAARDAADDAAEAELRAASQNGLEEQADAKAIIRALKEEQPFATIDELYAQAPVAQSFLDDIGRNIADEVGVTFKTPGLKKRETAIEKLERKRYASVRELTDIARGGFLVASAQQADAVVAKLAGRAVILDEGWSVTPAGYFDRKVIVQTPNGVLAEVQIWSPAMLKAKQKRGHALYEEARTSRDPDRVQELEAEMRAIYADALSREDPSFANVAGGESGPKVLSNRAPIASSEGSARPVSNTSSASTGSQAPPGERSANASSRDTSNSTVGLPSQSTNVMGNTSSTTVGAQAERVNVVPIDRDTVAVDGAAPDDLADLRSLPDDLDMELADGTTVTLRDFLDDLDQDDILATVVNTCGLRGAS